GVQVQESTFTQCGGGRQKVQSPVDLLPVAPLPVGTAIDRLGAAEPSGRAAAGESLARQQAEPSVCAGLAAASALSAAPDQLAATARLLSLARVPCVRASAYQAARVAGLERPAACALNRLHDEPARRALLPSLIRQGSRA